MVDITYTAVVIEKPHMMAMVMIWPKLSIISVNLKMPVTWRTADRTNKTYHEAMPLQRYLSYFCLETKKE
jgi:hypothetical protein